MKRLAAETKRTARKASDEAGKWLMGVTAIVAENQDAENQHRVKVIIPSIDEDVVYDEWARQMVFCLGNGYGTAFIPPKGSEVVLFGQLGQKYNLFYASLYNEDLPMPDGYPDENTVGIKAPANLKLIASTLMKLIGQNIEATADQVAKVEASDIYALAEQLVHVGGQTVESIASGQNKVAGQTLRLEGATIQVNGNGTITITGGQIQITGSSIKLFNRTVNPTGPSI